MGSLDRESRTLSTRRWIKNLDFTSQSLHYNEKYKPHAYLHYITKLSISRELIIGNLNSHSLCAQRLVDKFCNLKLSKDMNKVCFKAAEKHNTNLCFIGKYLEQSLEQYLAKLEEGRSNLK